MPQQPGGGNEERAPGGPLEGPGRRRDPADPLRQGRAIVITGEVQVSQCAGSFLSPSALSTDSRAT